MNAFMIDLKNKPGALADLAEALGSAGINITAVTGATCGDQGRVVLTADDESATRTALGKAGVAYVESEVATVNLRHQPGSLAAAARKLAAQGINIDAVMPLGMSGNEVTVAFVTSDPTATKELLTQAGATR
jgi:hypothetical protein